MALTQSQIDTSSATVRALTPRSVSLGILLVAIVNVGAPYAKYILHSSLLACDYLPFGVMLPFLLVITVVNPLIKTIGARPLIPEELAVIFVMSLVGSTIPTFGLTGYLLGTIASPYYYVRTENGWAELIHPHLPQWLFPTNDTQAMTWFYEGLPANQSIPWSVWIPPLFWWMTFIGSVLVVCFCLVAILRRQWIDRERIVFPLAQVPLDMVESSGDDRKMPAFMRTKIFWVGFALPSSIIFWNITGYFIPTFPTFLLKNRSSLFRGVPSLTLNIYFPLIGFAYLINLDVAFSVWFFHLLAIAQLWLYDRVGFTVGLGDNYCSASPELGWQGFGGMIVMVLWGLWMARDHLGDVFRKAIKDDPDVDDSRELLSYRSAVVAGVVALLYMVVFLHATGMTPDVIVVFLFAVFVIYLGVTRIVIEGGLVFLRGPMIAQHFTAYTLGVSSISPQSMTALAVSYAWFCDIKSFFMPAVAHASKLSDALKLNRKTILVSVGIALVTGVVTSVYYTLSTGYAEGAYNYGDWIFRRGSETPYDAIVKKMRNPFDTGWGKLGVMAGGGAVMALLSYLRYRLAWWPIHPIGLPVAYTLPVRLSWFSIFIAWAAKLVILRLGGIGMYRKAQPFFFGIIAGFFFAAGISFFVDMIWFPGEGHRVYGW
jgi:hypothetical protein